MGKTKKEVKNISICNVKLNFISKKIDNFDNEVSFFKVIEKTKFKPMLAYENNLEMRLPYFIGDNGSIILKVKNKFIAADSEYELQKITYDANLQFEYYNMTTDDGRTFTGFYCKMPNIEKSSIQVV